MHACRQCVLLQPSAAGLLASAGALSAAVEFQSRQSAAEGEGRKMLVDELLHVLPSVPTGASGKAAETARCAAQAVSVLARLGRHERASRICCTPSTLQATVQKPLSCVQGCQRAAASGGGGCERDRRAPAGQRRRRQGQGRCCCSTPDGCPWRACAGLPVARRSGLAGPSSAAAAARRCRAAQRAGALHCPPRCPGSCLRLRALAA